VNVARTIITDSNRSPPCFWSSSSSLAALLDSEPDGLAARTASSPPSPEEERAARLLLFLARAQFGEPPGRRGGNLPSSRSKRCSAAVSRRWPLGYSPAQRGLQPAPRGPAGAEELTPRRRASVRRWGFTDLETEATIKIYLAQHRIRHLRARCAASPGTSSEEARIVAQARSPETGHRASHVVLEVPLKRQCGGMAILSLLSSPTNSTESARCAAGPFYSKNAPDALSGWDVVAQPVGFALSLLILRQGDTSQDSHRAVRLLLNLG